MGTAGIMMWIGMVSNCLARHSMGGNMDLFSWILSHWVSLVATAGSVCMAASAITALTDTPRDDLWVARVYRVIEVLAMVTGKAKDVPGQSSSIKKSLFFHIVPLLLSILIMGCSIGMTPRERAVSFGYEAARSYHDLYRNYCDTAQRLEGEDKIMSPETGMWMDRLKRSIVAYNDLVIVWADTNATDIPTGLGCLERDIIQLIADINGSLMSMEE